VLISAEYPVQWMRMMMVCCEMAVRRMALLRLSVRKMKAPTVKMENVTLIDKGGWNLTCFV